MPHYDAKPNLNVGGMTCQCGECGLYFTGVSTFDLHRDKGRCRTDQEMRAKGMVPNQYGVWGTAPK